MLKLKYYGLNSIVVTWIKAFFAYRTQRVTLEGIKSSRTAVSSGVPQGSVLGPILFLLYINDLPKNIDSPIRLFADDAIIYRKIRSQRDCTILQHDLDSLAHWERKWLMNFNPAKCKSISITRIRHPIIIQYTLHGQALATVKSAKYFGITITSDLTWNKHIAAITAKANLTL